MKHSNDIQYLEHANCGLKVIYNMAMDLHYAGTPTEEIAKIMHRTPDSVRYKMIRMRKNESAN
jgi:hypothetical protein